MKGLKWGLMRIAILGVALWVLLPAAAFSRMEEGAKPKAEAKGSRMMGGGMGGGMGMMKGSGGMMGKMPDMMEMHGKGMDGGMRMMKMMGGDGPPRPQPGSA